VELVHSGDSVLYNDNLPHTQVMCVKFLLEQKDTRHLAVSCDDAGLTLLHYAVTHGNSDVIDLLMNKVIQ